VRVEDKLVAGVRAYTSLRLITQIASWLGTVYVVRHLTSHALGQYSVAFVLFSYLAMTYDGTLLEALIQRAPANTHERRAVFTLVVAMGVGLAIVTVACSSLVAHWVGDAAVRPLVMGVSVMLVLTAFSVMPYAALSRQMAFARLATIGAIQSVCVLVVTVGLAWRGAGAPRAGVLSGRRCGSRRHLGICASAGYSFSTSFCGAGTPRWTRSS
jgi:teichuronic acid exporter